MSCYRPLYAWDLGLKENGKRDVRFPKPGEITSETGLFDLVKRGSMIQVPCGKCEDCRLSYSRQWAVRCIKEAEQWPNSCMITLTYDEEHVPKNYRFDVETGEIEDYVLTLVKSDFQKFMKRLRKAFTNGSYSKDGKTWKFEPNNNIRYYMCGEYGETHGRPHYHVLLFNFEAPDRERHHINENGNPQDTSKLIEALWGNGFITINEINFETCAYVARYIMKKQKGSGAKEWYEKQGVVPEYVDMSRRPGIGYKYFEENKDKIYASDEIFINTRKGVQVFKPARYYDNLYDGINHERMLELKDQRKEVAQIAQAGTLANTSLSSSEYLEVKEENKKTKIKSLKRKLE